VADRSRKTRRVGGDGRGGDEDDMFDASAGPGYWR
jgi:hypothetical protein